MEDPLFDLLSGQSESDLQDWLDSPFCEVFVTYMQNEALGLSEAILRGEPVKPFKTNDEMRGAYQQCNRLHVMLMDGIKDDLREIYAEARRRKEQEEQKP